MEQNPITFAERVTAELDALHSEEKRVVLPRFFKCGVGEYGEGDRFLGVVVPDVRAVAKKNLFASLFDIEALLGSPWHEARLCALIILVQQSRKSVPKEVFEFYLSHTSGINNWDLVDLTAPSIVGGYLLENPQERERLYSLADSTLLWEQRIAIVSTAKLTICGYSCKKFFQRPVPEAIPALMSRRRLLPCLRPRTIPVPIPKDRKYDRFADSWTCKDRKAPFRWNWKPLTQRR